MPRTYSPAECHGDYKTGQAQHTTSPTPAHNALKDATSSPLPSHTAPHPVTIPTASLPTNNMLKWRARCRLSSVSGQSPGGAGLPQSAPRGACRCRCCELCRPTEPVCSSSSSSTTAGQQQQCQQQNNISRSMLTRARPNKVT